MGKKKKRSCEAGPQTSLPLRPKNTHARTHTCSHRKREGKRKNKEKGERERERRIHRPVTGLIIHLETYQQLGH